MFRCFSILTVLGLILMPQAATAVCGCTAMSIERANATTQDICTNTQHAGLGECMESAGGAGTACPNTTYVYTCPVGVNSTQWGAPAPSQKTGFVVDATLTGGNGSQCTSGQLLTLTIMENGVVAANPRINPTNSTGAAGQLVAGVTFDVDNAAAHQFPQYPIGGGTAAVPKFGGDDYRYANNAAVLIERTDVLYRWWDNTDQEKTNAPENASWRYKFVSFVKGSSAAQSSCACGFDIEVDWASNMNPTTTYTQDGTYSRNCNF
jgi:hypothetical protein